MKKNTLLLAILLLSLSAKAQEALFNAAGKGELATVQYYINNGSDINARDGNQYTVLMWAVYGKLETVQWLVQQGANINAVQKYGATALQWAIKGGHPEIVRYFLAQGADFSKKGIIYEYKNGAYTGTYWGSYYALAVASGKLDMLKVLAEAGVPITEKELDKDSQQATGWTARDWADYYKNHEMLAYIDKLLAAGSTASTTENNNNNNSSGDKPSIRITAADQNNLNKTPESPFFWGMEFTDQKALTLFVAIKQESLAKVKEAVQAGANVNHLHKNVSPLMLAALDRNLAVVRFLVEQGANPNQQAVIWKENATATVYGSPLSVAIAQNKPDMLAYFIEELGLDPATADHRTGKKPLDFANELNNSDMVTYLRTKLISGGNTHDALVAAIMRDDLEAVTEYVKSGADVNATHQNAPLLMWAALKGDLPLVEYLVNAGANFNKKGIIASADKTQPYGNLTGIAAATDKLSLLEYLIETCKIPTTDRGLTSGGSQNGRTALQWAQANEKETIISYFLGDQSLCGSVINAQKETLLRVKPGGHTNTVWDMEVTNNGKYLLTAGSDKTLKIWNLNLREVEQEIYGNLTEQGNEGAIYAIALSPNNQYLAVGGHMGTDSKYKGAIRLYDFPSRKLVAVLKSHTGIVYDLHFSEDNRYLVSASGDSNLKLWDVASRKLKKTFYEHTDAVSGAFMHGNFIYSSSLDGTVKKWKPESGAALKSYNVGEAVYKMDMSADGMYFALSGTVYNGSLVLDKQLEKYGWSEHGATQVAFTPNGRTLATVDARGDKTIIYKNNGNKYTDSQGLKYRWNFSLYLEDYNKGTLRFIDDETLVAVSNDNQLIIRKLSQYLNPNTRRAEDSSRPIYLSGKGRTVDHIAVKNGKVAFGKYGFYYTPDRNSTYYNYLDYEFDLLTGEVSPIKYQNVKDGFTTKHGHSHKTITYADYASATTFTEAYSLYNNSGNIPLELTDAAGNKTIITQTSNCYTFTPSGQIVVGKTTGELIAYDLQGNELAQFIGHASSVNDVAITPNGKYLVSGSTDQTVRVWELAKLQTAQCIAPTTSLFVGTDHEWVVWGNDGYYKSSRTGGKYLGYHINKGREKDAKFYPFEQFDFKFNRPDIVNQRLQLGDAKYNLALKKAYLKRLQKMGLKESDLSGDLHAPIVEMITQTGNSKNKTVDLRFRISDKKYQIDRVSIFVDDIPIFGKNGISLVNELPQTKEMSIPVALLKGKNKIQVLCRNIKGVESFKETVYLTYEGSAPQADMYVITIGVSEYANPKMNLNYSAKDAGDIAAAFALDMTTGGKLTNKLLLNHDATRENIKAVRDLLMESKPEDRVVMFVAGHGVLDAKYDYYFATHDMDFMNPAGKGLLYDDLEAILDGIPARNKLLLMDACHSGEVDKDNLIAAKEKATTKGKVKFRAVGDGVANKRVGLENSFELMKTLFADLRRSSGSTVISSAGGAEFAMEGDDWNNGVFTYSLIYGLESKEADLNQDGKVMLSELKKYVNLKVVDLTDGQQNPTSRRINLENDFVVRKY